MTQTTKKLSPRSHPKQPEGFLGRLQQKPKQEKNRIAFMSAVGATCIIGLVWFVSLTVNFSGGTVHEVIEVSSESKSVLSSTLGGLREQVANTISALPSRNEEPETEDSLQSIVDTLKSNPQEQPETQTQPPQATPEPASKPRMVLIATSSRATTSATKTPAEPQ